MSSRHARTRSRRRAFTLTLAGTVALGAAVPAVVFVAGPAASSEESAEEIALRERDSARRALDLVRRRAEERGRRAEQVRERVAEDVDLGLPAEGQAVVEVAGVGRLGAAGEPVAAPIASVAKIMTAYVVLRERPLGPEESGPAIVADAQAEAEREDLDQSTAPLVAGRSYTQRELLELMMLPSGNNAARLLARWDSGDERSFVRKMNAAARDLGMPNTTYTGATGFDPTTVSTAEDQMRLARAAMKVDAFRSVVAMRETHATGHPIRNSNKLLGQDGVIGLKTGSSTPAGGNLVWATTAEVAGEERLVIGVVLQQRAGIGPVEGRQAATEVSRAMVRAVRSRLPAAWDTAVAAAGGPVAPGDLPGEEGGAEVFTPVRPHDLLDTLDRV
ncbi:D-alanyl-D-alanine carboxypeptidase family protein (plasmid) [Streptomyces sp. BI20]|uniref:D-alanyl-D-alanine carboxypeptidase family protein n=1 Tax=Streptomyces sp. BI20 TaxID=3403460 RepID=UPI003C78E397